MPSVIPQLIVNGLVTGSIYVLVALSLGLLFGVLGVPDYAQGALLMLGGFGTYFLVALYGVPFVLAVPAAMLLVGVLGVLEYRLTYHHVRERPEAITLVLSLAVFIFYQNAAVLLWTGESRKFEVPRILTESLTLFGGTATYLRWLTIALVFTMVAAIYVFIRYTTVGTAMRAISQDRDVAYLMGIDVDRVSMLTFGISSALSAMAGGLLGAIFPIDPFVGQSEVLRGFVIIILGGAGNIAGALVGGLVLGLVESFSVYYVSSEYTTAIVFLALIVALVIKPEGLTGGDDR